MDKNVTINELKQSGMYEQEFLQDLQNGNIWRVEQLSIEKRSDRNFIIPLLYAVKNDLNTYQVYKYCGENIQIDVKLTAEVIKTEPSLIEGTPLSKDKEFILNNIETCPMLSQYMAPELKNDNNFINEIDKRIHQPVDKISELTMSILNNPDVRNDEAFISTAMEVDISFLKFASEELKNNYDFLKEQSKKNEKVIDYVVDNIQDFGLEGIKAVRESSKEFTIEDCLTLIDEMAKNSTDERYGKVKAKVEEKGIDDIHVMRWVTAMVAQRDDLDPELVKKVLNYSVLTMEKTKQDLSEDGRMNVNLENTHALITPLIINRLRENIERQGIAVEDDVKQKIDTYTEFYDSYYAQFKEQKKQNNRQNLGLSDISDATIGVTNSEIQLVTGEITSEVKNSVSTLSEKNNNSIEI